MLGEQIFLKGLKTLETAESDKQIYYKLTESPPVALGELGRGGHHFLSIIAPNDRLYMKFKTH